MQKTALITGAAEGTGKACAQTLAREGIAVGAARAEIVAARTLVFSLLGQSAP